MEIKYRANPNARDSMSTQKIMLRLTIGLLVVYAFGLYHAFTLGKAYLINAIILMVVALVCALGTEVNLILCMIYGMKCLLRVLQQKK